MTFSPSKRNFLRSSLGTVASAAVLSTFPPAIRRALAIDANNVTGTIKDVQHVVLLMLENRSFDSYFGTFKGVRGYGDRFAIPSPTGSSVFYQSYTNGGATSTLLPYHLDESQGNAQRAGSTPHSWADAQAAWDNGRMAAWPTSKKPLSMGYYETVEVPFHRALADAFTLCDAYHCGMHTGTIANRLFYWTGTNGPNGVTPGGNVPVRVAALNNEFNGGNDVGASTDGWTWTTYADRLQSAGVSWKVYQSLIDNFGCNEMMSFRHWRAAIEQMPAERRPLYVASTDITQAVTAAGPFYDASIDDPLSPLAKGFGNTMPQGFLETFRDDIQKGTLPAVSWIIPPSVYSEHPGPSSPTQGGWYVQEVLDALTANPEVWSKTVLLVNYDENDGFFDHVPPPSAPSHAADGSMAGASTLSDIEMAPEYHNFTPATSKQPASDGRPYGPGPRVPMWVISPWSRGGFVNSQVFDHTSTLMFLEKRFGVVEPQISSYRRAVCGDLTSCFDFVSPNSATLAALSGRTTKDSADSLATSQAASAAIAVPAATAASAVPAQATGSRPSRALPYELHTTAHISAGSGGIALEFANGSASGVGAVFHVYDRNHLDLVPRRYVVEAGKSLTGTWTVPAADNGRYDLWVLGPNGYHREFVGNLNEVSAAANPEIQVCYLPCDATSVSVKLHNRGNQPVTFTAAALAYRTDGPWSKTVAANSIGELSWPVTDSGNWYDFTVTSSTSAAFRRRFAGRIENGKDLVSDPAMGMKTGA
ncbi:phosphocholine-specific phospholipase C [Caballeronia sp. LZ043]|uniref:phosphocholine-specific phospholipase C n=1 Tax=Caballeronia sp. LZ043 TaxID=3038569 RepID=UPI00285D9930|nr:phospholipase C, phosphocholine-specific [Caballeronia sp. LZ043]MDR5821984.1 phospholipase C, phosphocholine-specific [Caballeronia sp. LZ043]